jgi:hypothetical protein
MSKLVNNNASEPKALTFLRKDVAKANQDIRNIVGMLKAGDIQMKDIVDRLDRVEGKLYGLHIEVAEYKTEATRIRYKAAREIRQHVRERLEALRLPPEHFRSNFYAALRRQFGGVNSYHDLPEAQVNEVHRFIDAWQPAPADVARLMGGASATIRVVVEPRRWDAMAGRKQR